MPGHLFTEYFLTEGIRATPEWRESVASADAFESFRDGVRERYGALSGSVGPERGGHGAGADSPRPGAARVDRLPSAAGRGAQRGYPRPPAVPRRRLEGAGRREG